MPLMTSIKKYGLYDEVLVSVKFPETKEGRDQMAAAMDALRKAPPSTIGGCKVIGLEDYWLQKKINVLTGEVSALTLPKSDVLSFRLDDHTKIIVRPSGTEPKIKLYCGTVSLPEGTTERYLNEIRGLLTLA